MTKEEYYKALLAQDSRFDGVFFVCVKTTHIYCRPVCPTHPPKIENCIFVATVAEAAMLGCRPCLRCRPELAPQVRSAEDSLAGRLGQRIENTLLLDETLGSVAAEYGVSERHLRRLFAASYGIEPKQYVTTRRLLFAKQLLQDTNLPIRDVAYDAGFSTPARLTITMRQAFGFTPDRFRKTKPKAKPQYLMLRADYRPPFDWEGLLAFLQGRATPAESIQNGQYTRIVDGLPIIVTNDSSRHHLCVQIPAELSHQAHKIIQSVRHLFDLDANPAAIEEVLRDDVQLQKLIAAYPGIRVPGSWDSFELTVRAILGQQVSVAGATTLAYRLADQIGLSAKAIAARSPAAVAAIGIPAKRATTIYELAAQVQSGRLNLEEKNPDIFSAQLLHMPGIGPWTVEYVLMRVLHWPDAFPAADLGVQKALGIAGKRGSEKTAMLAAQSWRPWRSYATMLLWRALSTGGKA